MSGAPEANSRQGVAFVFGYTSNAGFTVFSVPGSKDTLALGVNNLGQIVGAYDDSQNCSQGCGFLYENGLFTTIAYPGSIGTNAQGVNDAGEVVGSYSTTGGFPLQGFTYQDGVFATLNFPDATNTVLYGVNNLGDIVGRYFDDPNGAYHGFLYSDGVFTTIDPPGSQNTVLSGVNTSDEIVGTYCISICNTFVYSNGVFTEVNYPGTTGSTAIYGINDSGDLTGFWSPGPGQGSGFVFWNGSQQFVDFNIGGFDDSSGYGINNLDEIVGDFGLSTTYSFYGHLPGH